MEKRKKILIIGNGHYGGKPYGTLIDDTDYFEKIIRLSWYQLDEESKKFIGSRTDINSTIWWKYREEYKGNDLILVNNLPKYTIDEMNDAYRKTILTQRYDNLQSRLENAGRIIYAHNINDDDEIREFFHKNLNSTDKIKKVINDSGCNFSLGFRTLFIATKIFPDHDIYTHCIDFFTAKRETGGYYWAPQHNRHRANRHPYIYEKMCFEKLVKSKVLYKLNSVSNVQ